MARGGPIPTRRGWAMRFEEPLVEGRLRRRYKRFLADVELAGGETVTAHCPNSGSMKTCVGEGWPVRLSRATNPRRKLAWTLEMVHNGETWIGVNTQLANRIAAEAVETGRVPGLDSATGLRREVPYGHGSRIDLLVERTGGERIWVEVKNVTMIAPRADGGRPDYVFPDAVTRRGRKHMDELAAVAGAGEDRALVLFLVQRADGARFRPADEIDPAYGEALRDAARAGVEIIACRAEVTPEGIEVVDSVPVDLAPVSG